MTRYPIMNSAGAAVTSGNRSDAQPSYSNSAGGRANPHEVPPPGPFSYVQKWWRRVATKLVYTLLALIVMSAVIRSIFILNLPSRLELLVDSASVSSFNVSKSNLTANWDVGLTIRNPNKDWRIHYDSFVAYMLYHGENLAETSLPPFDQGKRNQTTMRVNFAAASANVSEDAGKSMAADRSQGVVNFNVKLVSRVRFISWWGVAKTLMTASCNNIRVSFSSNSGVWSMAGGPIGCGVVYEK